MLADNLNDSLRMEGQPTLAKGGWELLLVPQLVPDSGRLPNVRLELDVVAVPHR